VERIGRDIHSTTRRKEGLFSIASAIIVVLLAHLFALILKRNTDYELNRSHPRNKKKRTGEN
jgi:hypothetical protein